MSAVRLDMWVVDRTESRAATIGRLIMAKKAKKAKTKTKTKGKKGKKAAPARKKKRAVAKKAAARKASAQESAQAGCAASTSTSAQLRTCHGLHVHGRLRPGGGTDAADRPPVAGIPLSGGSRSVIRRCNGGLRLRPNPPYSRTVRPILGCGCISSVDCPPWAHAPRVCGCLSHPAGHCAGPISIAWPRPAE